MSEERILHCWAPGPAVESRETPGEMVDTTCMLLDGHEGNHEGIRDDEIMIRFLDATVRE